MKPETKKTLLISLWLSLAVIFLTAVGWLVYQWSLYKPYHDSQYHFSLKYPSKWVKKERAMGTAVSFVRPKQTALDVFQPNVNITVQEVPDNIATLASFSELITKQMTAVFEKNITIVEDKDVTFGERRGHWLIIDAPQPENMKAIFVWTIKGSFAYIFTYMSKINQYKELAPSVDHMIKSFEFK